MAGTGRIYRRGLIYYIAYRWEGREYRESARSSERGVGPSSCWPHGSPSGGGVVPRLHQSSTRWRRGISMTTACGASGRSIPRAGAWRT